MGDGRGRVPFEDRAPVVGLRRRAWKVDGDGVSVRAERVGFCRHRAAWSCEPVTPDVV